MNSNESNESTNVTNVTISSLVEVVRSGFVSRLFTFNAIFAVPGGWIELRKNRAFLAPDGTVTWSPFGLRPTPPAYTAWLPIVVMPPEWSELARCAIADAIANANGGAVESVSGAAS